MADINWLTVDVPETASFKTLQPGGYVGKIVDAEYNDRYGFWNYVFDIAEGEFAGFYSDDWGQSHPFAHSFIKNKYDFDGNPDGRFKRFLLDLQHSNRGKFDIAAWQAAGCDTSMFIGLEVGIVLQKMLKTNSKGVDTDYLEVYYTTASQDIRNGDFKLPEVKDKRQKVSQQFKPDIFKPTTINDDFIPFN